MKSIRVVFVLGLLLLALPLGAQTPPYVGTVIVGGAAAPAVNGTNLLAALAAIPSPGPANRWLVKVEPGTFDLGTQALVLRDYVDVEGSGRGSTLITSAIPQTSPFGATLFGGTLVHAEVRGLTVRNTAVENYGTGIYLSGSGLRITQVDVEVDSFYGGSGITVDSCSPEIVQTAIRMKASVSYGRLAGLYVIGGGPRVSDVQMSLEVPSTGFVRGAVLIDTAASVDRLTVLAPVAVLASQVGATGIEITRTLGGLGPANQPVITNARLTVGGPQAFGITVAGGAQPEIRDTVATASMSYFAAGLWVRTGSRARVYGSRLYGQGNNVGLGVLLESSSAAAELHHSTSEGTSNCYQANGGALSFGASQLLGTRPGGATCAASYDGAYTMLNGPC